MKKRLIIIQAFKHISITSLILKKHDVIVYYQDYLQRAISNCDSVYLYFRSLRNPFLIRKSATAYLREYPFNSELEEIIYFSDREDWIIPEFIEWAFSKKIKVTKIPDIEFVNEFEISIKNILRYFISLMTPYQWKIFRKISPIYIPRGDVIVGQVNEITRLAKTPEKKVLVLLDGYSEKYWKILDILLKEIASLGFSIYLREHPRICWRPRLLDSRYNLVDSNLSLSSDATEYYAAVTFWSTANAEVACSKSLYLFNLVEETRLLAESMDFKEALEKENTLFPLTKEELISCFIT